MNIYYELAENAVEQYGYRYFTAYTNDADSIGTIIDNSRKYFWLAAHSERIWVSDGDTVKFVKHRKTGRLDTPVDPKEFLWVQLKAKPLSAIQALA